MGMASMELTLKLVNFEFRFYVKISNLASKERLVVKIIELQLVVHKEGRFCRTPAKQAGQ